MKNPITKETEQLFNQGGNFESQRKQFYTTGRCNKCGKGNIECKCPRLNVNWFDAVDDIDRPTIAELNPASTSPIRPGSKGKPKKKSTLNDIP